MNRSARTALVVVVAVAVVFGIGIAIASTNHHGAKHPRVAANPRTSASATSTTRATPPPRPLPPSVAGYFTVLPPGSPMPSDATCAARVHRSKWEPVPENRVANHTVAPSPNTLGDFSQWNPTWNATYKPRINGSFTGTTDEIIQWVACKWGWSDNLVRAEAFVESHWRQAVGPKFGFGDYTSDPSSCTYDHQPPCPTSFGIMQVKWNFHPAGVLSNSPQSSYPWITRSTAYNLDVQVAEMRGCYDGMSTYLGNTTGDLWGCLQDWFSGSWTPGGGSYSAEVQAALTTEPWRDWAG
jgi:hypothetical protein